MDFTNPMLRLYLCDYSDVHIVVKGRTTVEGTVANNRTDAMFVFKNNAPFRSPIPKINNTFIDSAEDFDITMSMMYNLLEYSNNSTVTSGSLWNYYRREIL